MLEQPDEVLANPQSTDSPENPETEGTSSSSDEVALPSELDMAQRLRLDEIPQHCVVTVPVVVYRQY